MSLAIRPRHRVFVGEVSGVDITTPLGPMTVAQVVAEQAAVP